MSKVERGYESEPHTHLEGAARHLDAPLLQLDLAEALSTLRRVGAYGNAKHAAKTLAKYADLRVVLIAFEAGGWLDRHEAPGRVCIQVIDGKLAVRMDAQSVELRAGGVLALAPGVPHEVEAMEQSALLLTIAWPAK